MLIDEPVDDLLALGLSPAEEAAYELLVDRPPSTVTELALAWARPEHLTVVLAGLEAKGLLRLLPGAPAHYAAVPPEVALESLVLEREQQLQQARAHAERLAALYHEHAAHHRPGTVVEVVTGRRAVTQRITHLLRGTRNELIRSGGFPVLEPHHATTLEVGLLGGGAAARTLYDRAAVEKPHALPDIEELVRAGEEARVLRGLPIRFCLSDDRCAVLPLHREPVPTADGATVGSAALHPAFHGLGGAVSVEAVIVVHPSGLLDALGNLFEGMWQRAIPLDLTAAAPPPRRRGQRDDPRLAALLLSGLTDEAIARQLGIGYRTVQRRVATLMAQLGARTRFQAGVQAALRSESTMDTPESRPGSD